MGHGDILGGFVAPVGAKLSTAKGDSFKNSRKLVFNKG